jgi:hypothetical protein
MSSIHLYVFEFVPALAREGARLPLVSMNGAAVRGGRGESSGFGSIRDTRLPGLTARRTHEDHDRTINLACSPDRMLSGLTSDVA